MGSLITIARGLVYLKGKRLINQWVPDGNASQSCFLLSKEHIALGGNIEQGEPTGTVNNVKVPV